MMRFVMLSSVFALLFASIPVARGQEGWRPIQDRGLSVLYPAALFPEDAGPTEQGEGRKFRSRDGSLFAFYRLDNPHGESPRSYLSKKLVVDQSKILYRRVTDRFFVISSIRNERIFYSRCNFRADLHCIYLDYPQSQKRAFDPIVTRISHSLR